MGIEWAEDSPAQRAQIQTLYESLKGLRGFSERSTKAAAKYCTAGHKWCDAGDALAGELLSFTAPCWDSAVLGPALGKLGETMRQVHEHSRAHLAATEQLCGCSVMDPSKVDEGVQRVKEAKKRFVACDDEWRAALKKAHSVRTNTHTGKVLVADRGFVSTKLAFELARLGLVGAINELEAGAQTALLDALARAAAAQLAYHEAAAERLRREITARDHIILSLSFQRIKTQTEIRKLSIRRRPERGWPRGDHSVHDERRCERREVMLLSPLFEISQFGFVFLPFLCVPRVLLCVCAHVNGRVFTFVRVCAF